MSAEQLNVDDARYFENFESGVQRGLRRGMFMISLALRRALSSHRPASPPDWITTPHSKKWARDPDFASAYCYSVRAVGEDFRIPWRIQTLTWAASQTKFLSGGIVELGTGRGFSMAAVKTFMDLREMPARGVWCFDTFVPQRVSGLGDERHAFAYAHDYERVASIFNKWPDVVLVEGDVRETLSSRCPKLISLLHIDLNDPSVEVWALREVWGRLEEGAIVVLDDYANMGMEQSAISMDEVSRELDFTILSLPSGQGLFIKT